MHETNRLFIPIIWWINKLKGCIESFVSTVFVFCNSSRNDSDIPPLRAKNKKNNQVKFKAESSLVVSLNQYQ